MTTSTKVVAMQHNLSSTQNGKLQTCRYHSNSISKKMYRVYRLCKKSGRSGLLYLQEKKILPRTKHYTKPTKCPLKLLFVFVREK